MSSPVQHPKAGLLSRVAAMAVASLLVLALRIVRATWRIDKAETARLAALIADGEPTIAVFWHGQMVPLLALLDHQSALVLSSGGFRGSVIGHIVRSLGNMSLQVEDGGTMGPLRAALARPKGLLAIAVDGPLGPYHKVKPGALFLSATSGARIVPIGVRVTPQFALGRWDRLVLPPPFASVSLRVGPPLLVAKPDLTDIASAGQGVTDALEALTRA